MSNDKTTARAIDEAGIRAILSYGMIDFGDAERREAEIKEMQENLTQQTNDFSKFVDEEIKFSV